MELFHDSKEIDESKLDFLNYNTVTLYSVGVCLLPLSMIYHP